MGRALLGLWCVLLGLGGASLEAAPAGASPIPTRPSPVIPPPEASPSMVSASNVVTVFGFLLFAVAFALWLKARRRRGGKSGSSKGHFKFIETMPLGTHQVHLVVLGDRVYVLGSGSQGLTCLDVVREGTLHGSLVMAAAARPEEAHREFRDEYASMVREMSEAQKPSGGWQGRLSGELEEIRRRLKGLS